MWKLIAFRRASQLIRRCPTLLDRLHQWEDRWYQTIQAMLRRHFPDLCAKVFASLPRTSGLELVVTVPVLLRRLKDLETGVFGEPGEKARELLLRRGVTPHVIGIATQLLALGERARRPGITRRWTAGPRTRERVTAMRRDEVRRILLKVSPLTDRTAVTPRGRLGSAGVVSSLLPAGADRLSGAGR
jgi:hypothetical protein